ncbi:DUF4190 domain-containing protein [Agromyces sp. Leaf222]|uniref:DUF4190 domain-containing protein n=1 Tax=Agromyces sp. Leaf222 TaxID=1735688 RepID=UPI0006F6AADB|nr:DUF4190 domain-containing protein [Agromyces sp. Leaf222]KQM83941.1 hypothetical protein ASE68_12620 [Agromyces sp. Leaf222]
MAAAPYGQPDSPTPPGAAGPGASGPGADEPRNTLGLAALIVGLVAIVLAAIPFAAFVAWLPALGAVGLGVAALVSKRSKRRGQGVAGLVLGIVAFLLALIMSVVSAIWWATSSIEAAVEGAGFDASGEPYDEGAAQDMQVVPGTTEGYRADPFPIGETVEVTNLGEPYLSITIDEPDYDADAIIEAENEFNEAAPEGSSYVLVPVTVVYHDDASAPGAAASPWSDVVVSFETSDGLLVDEDFSVIPQPFFDLPDLQPGETGTGNMAFVVPDDAVDDGTWLVNVGWQAEFHYAAK